MTGCLPTAPRPSEGTIKGQLWGQGLPKGLGQGLGQGLGPCIVYLADLSQANAPKTKRKKEDKE